MCVTSVFIDEAGIHLGMVRGECTCFSHVFELLMLCLAFGALSFDGLIASMTLNGSVDTAVFLSYVNEVLAPQLWVGALVVMDNLKVHHAHSVRDAIEAVGARVVFLPSYSPDLSPTLAVLVETQAVLAIHCGPYL